MQTEFSNFVSDENELRAIPESAPDSIRTKIQAARDRKIAPAGDPEGWELLKQASQSLHGV